MEKTVVITGVSSGIGRACAETLAAAGWRVFGSVRTAAHAVELREQLGERFTPLGFDVTDPVAVSAAAAAVAGRLGGRRLNGLVNNAGIAVAGPVSHLPIDEFRRQLEVNVVGPMQVAQAFLPLLGTDPDRSGPPGRIVMISSVAGKLGAPFLAPYVASKHALEGLAESLRRELLFYGIDVVVVAPGHVATPIWDKAERVDVTPYQNLPITPILERFRNAFIAEGRRGLPPERIAAAVKTALTASRPKARYALVPGKFANWTLPRLLPPRAVDRLLARRLGLLRRHK
ncbi:MAG: SDR family oxidoreductase [Gammaproteobacteria bacterium]|nr:SDR family oxidoreductase [Gammaproteobacteria bacterium]